MSIVAFLFGFALTTTIGWCAVRLIEGKTVILDRIERLALSGIVGTTLSMFVVFLAHVVLHVPFTRIGMAATLIVLLVALCIARRMRKLLFLPPSLPHPTTGTLPQWAQIALGVLLLWSVIKLLIASVTFLTLTPTFLDDSLDNWNLRGKVFFVDHALTLVLPNENPVTSPRDVSSYPPTIPLFKTWLAALAGDWNDALVNAPHAVWYICALALLFFALRRRIGIWWAGVGTYVLMSQPLYLMHGTNTYGDVFLSAHLLAALTLLLTAWQSPKSQEGITALRLASLVIALIPFVKNEGMIVYMPPLVLLALLTAVRMRKKEPFLWIIGFLCAFVLPWLLFKWSHGLTFGNAKPFSTFTVTWQPGVLYSVFINTFLEGNWLLLFPLFFLLLIIRPAYAWKNLLPLTAFFAIVYIGQILLYLFTPLSVEALKQTGYARGLVHFVPIVVLLTTLLLHDLWKKLSATQGHHLDATDTRIF